MLNKNSLFVLMAALLLLTGCYHKPNHVSHPVTDSLTDYQLDSIAFERTHHYTQNYNFVVAADSMVLTLQMPEEAVSQLPTDSFAVYRNEPLVVADIRIMPNDSVDSVWVQLAQTQGLFGWIHESEMLKAVEPDDPISQFISFFSNEHLLIFLVIFVAIAFVYGMRRLLKHHAYIVLFKDIQTFYPTLLTIMVAMAATLYSSIQLFAPDDWREFYFHPSLNPFSQNALLGFFLASVWAMLIVGIAAVDDTFRHLQTTDAVHYLLGLLGICAVIYIIFTISTMYYVGYLFLLAYVGLALYQYLYHTKSKYVCGNCGKQIKQKGRCPHCGAVNV